MPHRGTGAPSAEKESQWTLKRLRWIAIAAPIVIVVLLEAVRLSTIGVTSAQSRLLLDGLAAIAVALMSLFMVSSVTRMQHRLARRNEELLALNSAGLDVAAELSLD